VSLSSNLNRRARPINLTWVRHAVCPRTFTALRSIRPLLNPFRDRLPDGVSHGGVPGVQVTGLVFLRAPLLFVHNPLARRQRLYPTTYLASVVKHGVPCQSRLPSYRALLRHLRHAASSLPLMSFRRPWQTLPVFLQHDTFCDVPHTDNLWGDFQRCWSHSCPDLWCQTVPSCTLRGFSRGAVCNRSAFATTTLLSPGGAHPCLDLSPSGLS